MKKKQLFWVQLATCECRSHGTKSGKSNRSLKSWQWVSPKLLECLLFSLSLPPGSHWPPGGWGWRAPCPSADAAPPQRWGPRWQWGWGGTGQSEHGSLSPALCRQGSAHPARPQAEAEAPGQKGVAWRYIHSPAGPVRPRSLLDDIRDSKGSAVDSTEVALRRSTARVCGGGGDRRGGE